MPRIRSVKPEAWRDKRLGTCSFEGQLLWVKLVTLADDAGRFPADLGTIAGHGYPRQLAEAVPLIPTWLAELSAARLIALYESDDEQYGVIPKFRVHQKINRPSQSLLPEPPLSIHGAFRYDSEKAPAQTPETPESRGLHDDSVSPHGTDPLPPINDQRSTGGGGASTDERTSSWGNGHGFAPIYDALLAAGYDALEIEQAATPIGAELTERMVPADADWYRFGQELREKREKGVIRRDGALAGFRFQLRSANGVPRIGQTPAGGGRGNDGWTDRRAELERLEAGAGSADVVEVQAR